MGPPGPFFARAASVPPFSLPEATKMRSPQMTGDDPLHDGSLAFHLMFSVSDHFSGRPVEVEVPLRDGPRHCGQFSSAPAEARHSRVSGIPSESRRMVISSLD